MFKWFCTIFSLGAPVNCCKHDIYSQASHKSPPKMMFGHLHSHLWPCGHPALTDTLIT